MNKFNMNLLELIVCYNCSVIGFVIDHKTHNITYANTAGEIINEHSGS